jgi:hypothetical protein
MLRRYVLVLAVWGVVLSCAGVALAEAPAPGWEVTGRFAPTMLHPGGEGLLYLYVYNVGALKSQGTATVTDTLPPGLIAEESTTHKLTVGAQLCPGSGRVVTCTIGEKVAPSSLPLLFAIPVSVEAGASGDPSPGDRVTVAGGGALGETTASIPAAFGSGNADAGISKVDMWFTNADGTIDTQAGSHPYELTIPLALNSEGLGYNTEPPAGGEVDTLDLNLPPGMVGDPNAVPQCTRAQLDGEECPEDSQIGEDHPLIGGQGLYNLSVYNMVPPPGVPAEFGMDVESAPVLIDAHLRSGSDGGITEHFNLPQYQIAFNSITLWGYPAERNGSGLPPRPLFTLPTSCGAPAEFSAQALATWQDPLASIPLASVVYHNSAGTPTGFTGCERLSRFEPAVSSLQPDTSFSDSPAGLEARVKVPQGLSPEGLATSGLKEVTVTLPEGVSVNPGQANGLAACSLSEAGVGSNSLSDGGPPACPAASRIGSDEIETPILKDRLRGSVYLLQSSPPDLQILVAASGDGANVKIVGNVHLDSVTGRLTATFNGTPQFPGLPDDPVSEFDLAFNGGPQAALVTPAMCGRYTSSASFVPWAGPLIENAFSEAAFAITSGPGGSGAAGCTGPLPFGPVLTAGSTTELAGGFTGLSVLLKRGDGQQRVSGLQVKAPEGLLGMIGSVPLCGEPQASAGTCPAASQIGHTVVGAGPGGYPLYLPQPGQPQAPIYLTGPYEGAPYGLSIVVPVVAGPFDLGTEVVRARVEVDPHTAQVIVSTDPLPQIIKGIPTDLTTLSAVIDRPGFLFNPTSCNPSSFTGSVRSTQGTVVDVSNRFQVGACAALGFKPAFSVSTQGKTSKASGASLSVKVAYPSGSQANLARIDVQLPKQLPARLSTLQQACTAAQFESNPAGCPVASDVGTVVAHTPALGVPLRGPAYLVSHGGAAFPDLEIVLQGGGITLVVDGQTQIRKGITSSHFESIPDAPISSFELSLPEGRYSALAAPGGSLCGKKLVMPTTLTGQDGALVKQSTPVKVTGCPKAKKKAKKKTSKRKGKGRVGGKGAKAGARKGDGASGRR